LFLSFPLRVEDGGFLRRSERSSAILLLMQLMARTPGGAWKACPNFGLRDLLESARRSADAPRLALERANAALQDLGFTDFTVEEIVREVSERRDYDVYQVTLASSAERYTTAVQFEIFEP
jgi:hypothetical protein